MAQSYVRAEVGCRNCRKDRTERSQNCSVPSKRKYRCAGRSYTSIRSPSSVAAGVMNASFVACSGVLARFTKSLSGLSPNET
jgi:hypothetical protein